MSKRPCLLKANMLAPPRLLPQPPLISLRLPSPRAQPQLLELRLFPAAPRCKTPQQNRRKRK
jgi:hypothetical protein